MTSEVDLKQTNELLQRRRLRLQQVREQSKDIAKKIRQRAKVETLRQLNDVDEKKVKKYFECQKQFVNRLQDLYTNGLENVGAGHRNASDQDKEDVDKKSDKSKLRGKEAVAEVRRKKQEILNKKKELLDRKLLARDTANERSREKSNTVVKNLQAPDTVSGNKEFVDKNHEISIVKKVDMATQLNYDEPLNDRQEDIPLLLLPESESIKDVTEKLDTIKKPNLFALSDEMPSSLRGGTSNIPQEIKHNKPSLTLVSEYIQNRRLRLRETETNSNNKRAEKLQNIKQTIQRTRASKAEGNDPSNVCKVLSDQFIAVPNWRAEPKCQINSPAALYSVLPPINSRKFKSIFNSCNKKTNIITRSKQNSEQIEEDREYSSRNDYGRNFIKSVQESNKENSEKTNNAESLRKGSITMYNHLTRDIKTIPCNDENLVIRDVNTEDDAFSNAQKQETHGSLKEMELQHKIAERRSKVAMAKENVDMEYRDTLAFLNSLPKDMSSKPNKTVYMDEKRQQQVKDDHERKLHQEYKNIEKECRKHRCKHTKSHLPCRPKSLNHEVKDLNEKKMQYSWMPVPEKERNLAIHNIPTTLKEVKHGNTVKFSDDNDYHEYRSSHKHTPPTKDIPNESKLPKSRYIETVLIEQNGNESTDCTSITSDTSSLDIDLNRREKIDKSLEEYDSKTSENDRIIIYKILNSKYDKRKKFRKKSTLADKNSKTIEATHKVVENKDINDVTNQTEQPTGKSDNNINKASFEQMKEGIYRTVKKNGDNMASLQFSDNPVTLEGEYFNKNNNFGHECCHCSKQETEGADTKVDPPHILNYDRPAQNCICLKNINRPEVQTVQNPSAATSTSSFKQDVNKVNIVESDGACIKLIDEGSQDNGKFYVGTTGYLRNETYEVVIQLRKKEFNGKDADHNREQDKFSNSVKETDINLPLQKSDVLVQTDNATNKTSECVNRQSDDINPDGQSPAPTCPPKSNDTIIESQPLLTKSRQEENCINKAVDNVSPQLSAALKQATSTYTQTTSSPIQRPIFMHMSSSTSTAYMSPPELIMPQFLKRDYHLSYDETCDSTAYNELQNFPREQCVCKHHRNIRKRLSHQTKTLNKCKKTNGTQISTSTTGQQSDYINKYVKAASFGVKKHTCRKCQNDSRKDKEFNSGKVIVTKDKKNPLHELKIPLNKNLQKIKHSKDNSKTALNPIIKEYVNKLLELNKEGMKAVEIINQDCSSVPTPGSSIVNNTFNVNKLSDPKKISLEQIKNILKQKIICDYRMNGNEIHKKDSKQYDKDLMLKNLKIRPKLVSKRKQIHKVKSLNISRKLSKTSKMSNCEKYNHEVHSHEPTSTSSSLKNDISGQQDISICNKQKYNWKSSDPPQKPGTESKRKRFESDLDCHRLVTTPFSTDSENVRSSSNSNHKKREHTPPAHISTQTSGTLESENNFMKVAEGKLQNMEKIADLTEKCTKRLSNLAKVLEEVRRNKSLAYTHITSSDSTSDSDLERNKNVTKNRSPLLDYPDFKNPFNKVSSLAISSEDGNEKTDTMTEFKDTFIPVLANIAKPFNFEAPLSAVTNKSVSPSKEIGKSVMENFKLRGKPPPALSRIHLKNEIEQIIPHELSTVLEVDSPMSLKLKSRSRIDNNADVSKNSNESVERMPEKEDLSNGHVIVPPPTPVKERFNTGLAATNTYKQKDPSNDSKVVMMDLKQFNEIMLKPFISIQEYAKKKNIETLDEASTVDVHLKDTLTNEDLSSLHSENSLPDVIAELLKRKIINEPFKYDTASNVNTSTISSESTISLLALSNSRKERKKDIFQNKKYTSELSDNTLSISSNPDLEHAFQKLGMGWASSTLKKTKERLALSSSSNTSSSSGIQFRNKNINYPCTTYEPVAVLKSVDKSPLKNQNESEVSKNAEQQTSLPNSMTVKEFLTNELAKKITFIKKSAGDKTDQEFVSLYETKMPDEMKQKTHEEDQSANCSNNNNRARTSTPVQIFRSMTYHSSSSTNTSNGLFSNADDLSSVKVTSNSVRNHSTSDKDDLTIPNYILRASKAHSDCSKSDNY